MVFYNLWGVLGAAGGALSSWGIVYLANLGGEEFLLLWSAFMGLFGLLVDRIPPGRTLRNYFTFIAPDGPPSRIAHLGVPLIVAPVVVLIFSVLTPLEENIPPPSKEYLIHLAVIAAVVLSAVGVLAQMKRPAVGRMPEEGKPPDQPEPPAEMRRGLFWEGRKIALAYIGVAVFLAVINAFTMMAGAYIPALLSVAPGLLLVGLMGLIEPRVALVGSHLGNVYRFPRWALVVGVTLFVVGFLIGGYICFFLIEANAQPFYF